MLSLKEIHLLIDQGLNTLGIFTEQALLHEQVDLAINHVVEKHIRDLKNTPSSAYSMVEKSIVEYMTATFSTPISFNGRYYEATRPEDFGELSSSYTVFGLCNCIGDDCNDPVPFTCIDCTEVIDTSVKAGKYYIVLDGIVKYNGQNYKKNSVFKGVVGQTSAQGKYANLPVSEFPNIITAVDSLESYSLSALVRNSFKPLLAWDKNKFYIYYRPIRKDHKIPLELFVNYIKDYSDALKISWCDNKTLDFPSDIQRYYIDLAIAYIAMINKQDQQNIVNLKSETI